MEKLEQLLTEYGESHQHQTNKAIHWICVPAIFFSITGLLYSIKLPWNLLGCQLNIAIPVMILVIIYYAKLSAAIWPGMLLFSALCLVTCYLIEMNFSISLWKISLAIFVLDWIGQFYGHTVEGKKTSFLKDLQFLLIGPAWLMSFIYKKMGIKL